MTNPMDAPLVSVVTPAYKAEAFIEQTMRSVCAQDYRPLEHVVVDDCSPDATGDIARELAGVLQGDDYSVRVVSHAKNAGTATALNTGISESRGQFISWLSADDLFVLPGKTRVQVAAALADPDASGWFDRQCYQGADAAHSKLFRPDWPRLLRFRPGLRSFEPKDTLIGLLFANPVNGTSVLLRRDSMPSGDAFDAVLGTFDQDGDLWLRMQALGLRLRPVSQAGTLYRIHPGQNSNLSAAMEEGMSVARIRVLLALDHAGRLLPALDSALPTLALGVASRAHRSQPATFSAVAQLASPKASGALRAVLRGLSKDLSRYPVVEQELWRERMLQAQQRRDSPTFRAFEEQLLRPTELR